MEDMKYIEDMEDMKNMEDICLCHLPAAEDCSR